jgi:hypothetical protein
LSLPILFTRAGGGKGGIRRLSQRRGVDPTENFICCDARTVGRSMKFDMLEFSIRIMPDDP